MMSKEEILKTFKDLSLNSEDESEKIWTLEPYMLKEEGIHIWIINDTITKPLSEK